jgi:integrase
MNAETQQRMHIDEAQLELLLNVRDYIVKEVGRQIAEAAAAMAAASAAAAKPPAGKRKGYNLVKRESKKYGHIYYVRYWYDGRMLPSKWCTHTGNAEDAATFAIKNRDRLITEYLGRGGRVHFYKLLSEYYKEGSGQRESDERRERKLGERQRRAYNSVINRYFIPYLKAKKINAPEKTDAAAISGFQDHLSALGIRPQTVNSYLSGIRKIFASLRAKGKLKDNPFDGVARLAVGRGDQKARGCYDIERVKGAFGEPWAAEKPYLLALLIYSTGIRNSEIERLKAEDITDIGGRWFLDIKDSKTDNGIRKVPLHNFVKERLDEYIKSNKRDGYIFTKSGGAIQSTVYKAANDALAARLNASAVEVAEQNITFYSGRHYWKTLMNAGELGEGIEEIFMGHSVSGEVSKRYNHKDKRGLESMLKKADEVFAILDGALFGTP